MNSQEEINTIDKTNEINTSSSLQLTTQENIHKKRGRPKKIILQQPIIDKIIEHELIVYFPIHYNSNDDAFELSDNNNKSDKKDIFSLNSLIENNNSLLSNCDSIIINDKNNVFNIKYSELLIKCPFSTNDNNIIIEPKYTNICCMHDTCKIKGKPYFLPDKFIDGIFYIIGWFCSLNCALAYNLNLKDDNINQRTNLLYYLYQINNENILPAPDKILLKKYGGEYDITEYRKLNKTNEHIILNNHPLICNNSIIDIIKN